MITSRPAVQAFVSHVFRCVCRSPWSHTATKRIANRRHRRALNRITRRMQHDPESFYSEGFNAPSLSTWDLW